MEVVFENQFMRDFAFALIVVFIGFMIQFAAQFFSEWAREEGRNWKDSRFLWSIFLICLIFNRFSFLMADFYYGMVNRQFWLDIGYVSIYIGMSIFILIQEETLNLRTRGLLALANIASLLVLILVPREIQMMIAVILMILYTILFLAFVNTILKVSSPVDKAYFSLFVLGVILYVLGDLLTSDIAVRLAGCRGYIIGVILILVGGYLANAGLYYLPSFNDIGWQNWIKEIYVLYENGIPILHAKIEDRKFTTAESQEEIILAAGILTALKSALKIITKSKKETALVDQGDIKLIFSIKNKVCVIVLSERDSSVIRRKINEFLSMFVEFYKEELKEWRGDISVFKPAYNLIKSIFLKESK